MPRLYQNTPLPTTPPRSQSVMGWSAACPAGALPSTRRAPRDTSPNRPHQTTDTCQTACLAGRARCPQRAARHRPPLRTVRTRLLIRVRLRAPLVGRVALNAPQNEISMRKNLGCKKSPADEKVFGIICGKGLGEHANHIQINRQQRGADGACPRPRSRPRSVCRRRAQPQRPCKKVVSRGLSPCVPDRITSTVSQGSTPS